MVKVILDSQIWNILNMGLCQIGDYTICGGWNLRRFMQISPGKNQISGFSESSRPRELPPQSLTQPDVNLSVHPAPIDQPFVVPVASVQTD